jgi:hypothetical protein
MACDWTPSALPAQIMGFIAKRATQFHGDACVSPRHKMLSDSKALSSER